MKPERRAIPTDLRHFRAGRRARMDLVWAACFYVGLIYLCVVGPVDLEAARVTAAITEEEGARRAPANEDPPDLFAGDPRELHRLELDSPLTCLPPAREWIRQWGDGRLPWETHPVTGQRAWACVNADLRPKVLHVP